MWECLKITRRAVHIHQQVTVLQMSYFHFPIPLSFPLLIFITQQTIFM